MSSPTVARTRGDRPARTGPALLGFLAVVVVAAALGGVAASSASDTYANLDLPSFAPPSSVFGPVWSVLYLTIAVAGWLTWREVGFDRSLVWWSVQLVLNACWTPLFFGADRYGLALVEIVVLLVSVGITIAMFWSRRRAAAVLMLPYLAWVGFATALNAAIWRSN